MSCSKGTYIRTLAEDISIALGSCGHLVSLRRLGVEPFDPGGMISLDDFEAAVARGSWEEFLLPLDAGLSGWPQVQLCPEDAGRFIHGVPVAVESGRGMVRVAGPEGRILGLAEVLDDGFARPKRVFVMTQTP
ncbi:MAG: tRNA pseudouridine(55) synthase TruB [Lysobacterales bacterium]